MMNTVRSLTKSQKIQRRYQKELKNTITEIKNTLKGINESANLEITQAEQKKEKRIFKNEDSLSDLWDNIKCINIHIKGVTEGKEREKGAENLFKEIISEIFPNPGKETDIQVQEAQRVSNKMKPKRYKPRHTVIKTEKKLNIKREY